MTEEVKAKIEAAKTQEELEALKKELASSGELSEEDLDAINGGKIYVPCH